MYGFNIFKGDDVLEETTNANKRERSIPEETATLSDDDDPIIAPQKKKAKISIIDDDDDDDDWSWSPTLTDSWNIEYKRKNCFFCFHSFIFLLSTYQSIQKFQ